MGFKRLCKIAKGDCFLRHVRLFVGMEQLGSHWMDFHEIGTGFFENLSRKFKFH
jgi:hypothetical protein